MTVILSDTFTGTNGDAWNASNWTTRLVGASTAATIQTNRGRLVADTGAYAVGVALGAPASGTCDDFELLFSWADASGGEQYIDIDYRIGTNATSGIPASRW